jgi:hypothetical protein
MKADTWNHGCYLEGWRGWRITADAVSLALDSGWSPENVSEIRSAVGAIDNDDMQLSIDAQDILIDAEESALEYLTQCHAPEGSFFGWHDGELMLWSLESWEAVG